MKMNTAMNHLSYQSVPISRHPSQSRVLVCAKIVTRLVLLLNIVLVSYVAFDRSENAVRVAIFVVPTANAFVAIVSLALIPTVRRSSGGGRVWPYVSAAIFDPCLAIIFSEFCIFVILMFTLRR